MCRIRGSLPPGANSLACSTSGVTVRAYFDHAATSPMPEAVLLSYTAALKTVGNPASQHSHGQQVRDVLESAREQIARELGVTAAEVIFTSGGTESINLALKGLFWQRNRAAETAARPRPVILAAMGEHHATVDSLHWLADNQGAIIEWLPLNSDGVLTAEVLAEAIDRVGEDRIALATVLWANNEIGTVQPVAELNRLCDERRIPLHVDAVAALGQLELQGVRPAAVSFSAHKIGGPVSSGVLLLRRDQQLQPLIHGGSQQRARSGTQDAAAAVAFATALQLASPTPEKLAKLSALRDRILAGVIAAVPEAILRGADPRKTSDIVRIPGNLHFTFPGCQGDSLLFLLDQAGVSVSTGSACTAGVAEVSHVMLAIGLDEETAAGALRFTFNENTSEEEVTALLTALPGAYAQAKKAGLL